MTEDPFTHDIGRVAEGLKEGGVAIVPTDTVYGVAASLDRPEAIGRIFDLKGRPADRPIPILVSGRDAINKYGTEISERTIRLIEEFWPGALTVIVPATPAVPEACLAGGNTVGLRMPDHPELLALISRCGGALAVTSANKSGDPETTTAREAYESLRELADIVLDTGPTPGRKPSTVVNANVDPPRIIRDAGIPESRIFDALRTD
ncbi:MAG: L-threonylcarbamoyladenylate synthase [Thermomicrobiales bacterium]